MQAERSSRDWLTALAAVGPTLDEGPDSGIVHAFIELLNDRFHWPVIELWVQMGPELLLTDSHYDRLPELDELRAESAALRLSPSMSLPGIALQTGREMWVIGATESEQIERLAIFARAGISTAVALPLRGLQEEAALLLLDFGQRRPTADEKTALLSAVYEFSYRLRARADRNSLLPQNQLSRGSSLQLKSVARFGYCLQSSEPLSAAS